MPRPRIKLLLFLVTLSLALTAAASTLWYRSFNPDYNDLLRLGDRHSIRSQYGSVSLYAPPPRTTSATRVEQSLRQLTNDDLEWTIVLHNFPDRQEAHPHGLSTRLDSPASAALETVPSTSLKRPLLDALDDPRRFAVAHAWLTRRFQPRVYLAGQREGDRLRVEFNGLKATLQPAALPPRPSPPPPPEHETLSQEVTRIFGAYPNGLPNPIQVTAAESKSTTLDPAQIPTLRRQWHDQLAVKQGAIQHGTLVRISTISSFFFAALLLHRLRRRKLLRRQAQNLCPICGYDLRATPHQCPECGTPRPGLLLAHTASSFSRRERAG